MAFENVQRTVLQSSKKFQCLISIVKSMAAHTDTENT